MRIPYAMLRGHGFYLRLRTPTDLAPTIGQHLVRSLSTRCPREARARAAQAAADAPAWWNVLRRDMLKILGKSLDELTATDLNRNTLAAAAAEMAGMSAKDKEQIHAVAVWRRFSAIFALWLADGGEQRHPKITLSGAGFSDAGDLGDLPARPKAAENLGLRKSTGGGVGGPVGERREQSLHL